MLNAENQDIDMQKNRDLREEDLEALMYKAQLTIQLLHEQLKTRE